MKKQELFHGLTTTKAPFIEKAQSDVEKNKKDLIEANSYLASYYGLNKDFANAKIYFTKVMELDPANESAKTFLSSKEGK